MQSALGSQCKEDHILPIFVCATSPLRLAAELSVPLVCPVRISCAARFLPGVKFGVVCSAAHPRLYFYTQLPIFVHSPQPPHPPAAGSTPHPQEMNKEFYCETCGKQYKNVTEMSNHYSSYDHHHVKVKRR